MLLIFVYQHLFRDPHGIASKKDKILSVFMIVIAVFSNAVAVYSDARSLFVKDNDSQT
jgi:solute carrier family 38 (sodium-coupled neutral amino acid transporter), member 2